MSPADLAIAARLIIEGRGSPVTLYLRHLPGRSCPEVTTQIPTGRVEWSYVKLWTYDRGITLDELWKDLNSAEAELTKRGRGVRVHTRRRLPQAKRAAR